MTDFAGQTVIDVVVAGMVVDFVFAFAAGWTAIDIEGRESVGKVKSEYFRDLRSVVLRIRRRNADSGF